MGRLSGVHVIRRDDIAPIDLPGGSWSRVLLTKERVGSDVALGDHYGRFLQHVSRRAAVNNRRAAEAEYLYRRGALYLLEGDTARARGLFAATAPAFPEWGFPEPYRRPEAAMYLRLIDAAAKPRDQR